MTGAADRPLPLQGVRVIDIGVVWAGPFGAMILGDLGAEVIKVENHHVWQPFTRGQTARPTKEMIRAMSPWAGGMPSWDPGERPWERQPAAIHLFRNKYSMTVDLRTQSGKEIFSRLVERSDVLYENNAPETIEKLGLTYDELRRVKEDIIMFSAPAFGLSGPLMNYRAFGSHIEAVIGHTMLRGYEDLDPSSNTSIYSGDYMSGVCGAFAIIAALLYRKRTGRGQHIEMAQAENNMAMFAQAIMDYTMNGRVQRTIGNHDIHGAAPNGVYPCRGDDRWIAISVYRDGEWLALCDVLGDRRLAHDERFATAHARRANEDTLDRAIAALTPAHDARGLALILQERGVPAGPVMDSRDILEDPHFAERRYFQWVDHPHTGLNRWPGPMYKLSKTPLSIRRPPASLGGDNEYVYKQVLGYTDTEYERFCAEGQIGDTVDPGVG